MSHQYKYNLPVTFDGKHSQWGEPEPRSPRYCPMTSRQGQDSSQLPVIEKVWFKKKKKYIEPQTSIKRFFKTRCNLYIQPMLMLSALQFSQKIFYSVRHIQQVEGEDRHSQYAGVVGDELAWHNRWYLDINSFEGSHNTWYFWRGWGSWIFEKSMKTTPMYWGITIFSNFNVRVGEKRQFLSDSKKHEFWSKMGWKCLVL